MKGTQSKLLLLAAAIIILAAFNWDFTKRTFEQCRDLLSKGWAAAGPALHLGGAASPAENRSEPAPVSDAVTQAQAAVEAYMHRYASPQSTLSFLDWSGFSSFGPSSTITLRYRVQKPLRDDVMATVRFSIQSGTVVRTEVVQPGLQTGPSPQTVQAPVVRPVRIPVRPPVVLDRFSGPLFSALHGPSLTLQLSDAFSLAQLDQAKAAAQAQRKPLGFLMVWGQFFGREADPASKGSDSALVHYYEAFHQQLVLVFVRHETELGLVPPAVKKGFQGPDEGGYAPNMAVTDATATEFIVEIPFRGLDAAGRDQLFAAGGRTIDLWLATHPDAMATPAAAMPGP